MNREIKNAIEKLAGTYLKDEIYLLLCNVDAVNPAARTCDCTTISGEGSVKLVVNLQAEVADGILIVPSVNSTILVAHSKRGQPHVLLFSDIDSVQWVAGSSTVLFKDGLVQFNDGSYGGLVQIAQLVTKLNNLENLVNDLISKFNLHTHSGVSTGGGTSGPTATTESNTLTPTKQSDLENTVVTHGK